MCARKIAIEATALCTRMKNPLRNANGSVSCAQQLYNSRLALRTCVEFRIYEYTPFFVCSVDNLCNARLKYEKYHKTFYSHRHQNPRILFKKTISYRNNYSFFFNIQNKLLIMLSLTYVIPHFLMYSIKY